MISFIISSYRESLYDALIESLKITVSCRYEVIKTSNEHGSSLTRIYNQAAQRSQYPYLCFLHEDVVIYNKGWDKTFINQFNQFPNTGIIGVAGSKLTTKYPIGWPTGINRCDRAHMIQGYKDQPSRYFTWQGSDIEPVKSVDGVFMFTHKEVWKKVMFNERIEGFHCYDIDFTLRTSTYFQNYISRRILIEHKSPGSFGTEWLTNTLKYSKLYIEGMSLKADEKSQIRKYWYSFLSDKPLSNLLKIKFVLKLGIDRKSIFTLLEFLIPGFYCIALRDNYLRRQFNLKEIAKENNYQIADLDLDEK